MNLIHHYLGLARRIQFVIARTARTKQSIKSKKWIATPTLSPRNDILKCHSKALAEESMNPPCHCEGVKRPKQSLKSKKMDCHGDFVASQ